MYKIGRRINYYSERNDEGDTISDVIMYTSPTIEGMVWRFANTSEFMNVCVRTINTILKLDCGDECLIKTDLFEQGLNSEKKFKVFYYVTKTK